MIRLLAAGLSFVVCAVCLGVQLGYPVISLGLKAVLPIKSQEVTLASTANALRSMARQLRDTANGLDRHAKDLEDAERAAPPDAPVQLAGKHGEVHPRAEVKKK